MKRILFVFLVIPFFQCKYPKEGVNKSPESKAEVNNEWLLKQYKSISFDTLMIDPSDKPQDEKYLFKGKKLDSACIKLLPREFSATYSYDSNFYACFKFRIDSSRTGLITRTPSDYESSIKLLIFDKKVDSVVGYVELADLLADAGDVMNKCSFLFNDQTKELHCLIWEQNSHDNSVNYARDTSIDLHNNYFLISLAKQHIDTISTEAGALRRKFYGLLRKPG
jgi:hypothetical protein